MAELEKTVKGLQHCFNAKCEGCPYGDTESGHYACRKHEMLGDALELLKEKEPRVMTLEEVIHSGNGMMWIEIKCAKPPYFMLEPTSPYTDNDERWLYVRFQSGHVQSKGLYGRQWRCWNTRPTDEQRMAVKWND